MLASPIVDLLPAQDDRWAQLLERCPHDVYQCPRYCSVSARVDCGVAQAALVQQDAQSMLLPFVRRELPGGLWDGVSPYGYPGPVWTAGTDPDRLDEMFDLDGTLIDGMCHHVIAWRHALPRPRRT